MVLPPLSVQFAGFSSLLMFLLLLHGNMGALHSFLVFLFYLVVFLLLIGRIAFTVIAITCILIWSGRGAQVAHLLLLTLCFSSAPFIPSCFFPALL